MLPRQIGHAAIVLSFVAALVATISYFLATQKEKNGSDTEGSISWQKLGRLAFGVHGVAVFTIIATIFSVMINKRFEYFYAHSHVDTELPFRYVFAAFWEGQEGSFLLWMFWHVGLGGWLILQNRKGATGSFENPVLATCFNSSFLGFDGFGLTFWLRRTRYKMGQQPDFIAP